MGTVETKAEGQPIAGAVVTVEGTNLSAVANAAGRFRVDGVGPGTATLIVRAPGFLETRVPGVQVPSNPNTPVTIQMDWTPNFLERVQVTATKRPLSIGDVPAQTDIVDRSTIEARGDQTLTEANRRGANKRRGAPLSAKYSGVDCFAVTDNRPQVLTCRKQPVIA